MSKRVLWVVEMRLGNEWVSTTATGITREDARERVKIIRKQNAKPVFRLVAYVPRWL